MVRAKQDYQHDVFVSYSNDDKELVRDIVDFLEHIGLKPWFDKDQIEYGNIPSKIESAIKQSRFFMLCSSNRTGRSQWLELEAKCFQETRGREQPQPLILLELSESVTLPLSLDVGARTKHSIRFEPSFIKGLIELVSIFRKNEGGILKYYDRRVDVGPKVWGMLYTRASEKINLLGQSMAGAFAGDRETKLILPAIRDRNIPIKVLLLTPNKPRLQQFVEVQAGLKSKTDLKEKIEGAICKIRGLKKILGDAGANSRLQVRISDRIIYSSIAIFDSLALVTNYSTREEIGNNSPTLLVCATKAQNGELFTFCEKEFQRYWKDGTHPEEDKRKTEFDASARILKHKEQIFQIQQWTKKKLYPLPPPTMLVIYPTYKCFWTDQKGNEHALCENCIYADELGSKQCLDFDVLCNILDQALAMGIENIEFSGGGEPLQYKYISDLLKHLQMIKEEKQNLKFGLLTNGLHLIDDIVPLVAGVFSYVRLSYAEGTQENEKVEGEFINGLKKLLSLERTDYGGVRIGLKLLLSHQNAKMLMGKLLALRQILGNDFARLNHIRVKAMRSLDRNKFEPTLGECLDFRNEFYDYLFSQDDWPEDVQIDLDLHRVSDTFRCQLTPLCAVVDPTGSLLACWNYLRDYDRLKIGDLSIQTLKHIWGSERHREIINNIDPRNVCNADNGCPCRFVEYQSVLEKPDRPHSVKVPTAIEGFL